MTAFAGSPPNYPALVLYPLNDTFQAKNILLHQRAKIGRQSNAKTIPTERNGYFDTKVISRQHAEVWVEDSKVSLMPLGSTSVSLTLLLLLPRFGSKTSRAVTARM